MDRAVTLRACPVRLFTPEIRAWVDLFYLTHELERGAWRRVGLPAAGGADDQDPRTLEALDTIAEAWNALIVEAKQRAAERAARKG